MVTLAQPRLSQAPGPDWVIDPEQQPQKVNHRSVTQGYYIDLYSHQIHVEKKARYFRIIREIISEAGIQSASEIWMQFNPAYEKTVIHTVTVWRNGEPINKLKIDDFKLIANESQSQNFIYNGSYSAYLILEDIRVGDRIEYAYTITGANPVFEGRFFSDLYLQNDAVIGQLYASILVDPQRHLNMRCMNQAKLPDKQSVKNLDRYQWHDTHIPAVEYEAYQPSWYNAYRYVQITEYKTWEEVAAWAARVNPLKETLGTELLKLTAQWRKQSAGDKEVFISKALRLVQDEIRYTGISIGEYSHRAGDPDKIYRQRFGDCKDKSLLLASILQNEGIEASVALVSTWLGSKVEDQLPSPLAFDHAVVYFEYEGRPYWIDPTISYQGGSLREIRFPVSGKGLVLHGPKVGFRPGGYDVRGNVDCEEEYELIAADSTTALLSVKTIYTGWKADEMRSSLAYSSLAETEKNYLDYYTRLYPEAELADSLVVERMTGTRTASLYSNHTVSLSS